MSIIGGINYRSKMTKTKLIPNDGTPTKLISAEIMQNKLYYLRGQQVMLDYDLAEIYGYSTSAFNQQVARNVEKFEGEDFMFRLKEKDLVELSLSQNVIAIQTQGVKGGRSILPYAFTEQGIYMLMTVLRGELAVKQSRALIRMFKSMKDYIVKNQEQIDYRSNLQLALKVADNTENISIVKSELKKLDNEMKAVNKKLNDVVKRSEISPIILDFSKTTEQREFLFLNGQLAKASEAHIDIYSKAKYSIYIIDDYISIKTLRHLCKVKSGVEVTIFTDNLGNYLHQNDYNDFKREFPQLEIKFVKTNHQIHDRFIILDYKMPSEKIYHSGASEKDAGNRIATIVRLDDGLVRNALHDVVDYLKHNQELKLK